MEFDLEWMNEDIKRKKENLQALQDKTLNHARTQRKEKNII